MVFSLMLVDFEFDCLFFEFLVCDGFIFRCFFGGGGVDNFGLVVVELCDFWIGFFMVGDNVVLFEMLLLIFMFFLF